MNVEEYTRYIESCLTYEQLDSIKIKINSVRYISDSDISRLMQLIDIQADKIANDD